MRVKLWLLDLNQEFLSGKDAVFLWGISNAGKRVLLVDDSVESFFFLKPLNGVDPDEAVRAAFPEGKRHGITRMEVCDKLVLGKPVRVVKVCVDRSDNVEKAAGRLEKLKLFEKAYESDLRLSTRYLLEKNLTPSSWFEAEVEINPFLPSIPNVEAFKVNAVRPLEEEKPPELRVMAVHLLKVGGKGSPKPEYDPIVAISTYDGKELKQFRFDGKTDRFLIEGFLDQVKKFDPDVIVGYGITEDWSYLVERCKRVDVQLEVGRNYAKPHTSVFGHVSVTGRISIDLFHNARENPQLTEYTLDEYAESLGFRVGQRIPEHKYSEYLSSSSEAEKLFKQSEEYARLLHRIWMMLGDFAIQLSQITGLPMDHVFTASSGHRAEAYLIREAYSLGELIPPRVEKPYVPYAGGLVLQPQEGVYENVSVIDFSSMYPNIMLKYNVSPDTYVPEGEECKDCYVSPESKHRFRKDYRGVYTRMLQKLLEARRSVRKRLENVEEGSVEHRILDARQKALKILANTLYGYAGWIGARWYLRQVAESVAEWGRYTITMAIQKAGQMGMKIVYGDTDSIFVMGGEKLKELVGWIESELEMEARVDKKYRRILFTEAKKRYGGLLEDGGLEVVGLEVVRGDWAEIAKETQLGVLKTMLETMDVGKAVSYVRYIIAETRSGRVEMEKMIIWKRMTKPPEAYEVRAPHVLAALELSKRGWRIDVGDKVGYVIVKGSSKIGERAKPYQLVEKRDVDYEYYVKNQIVPAAMRILKVFGVDEQNLLQESKRGLMAFGAD
ncbi:MAG: DNA polymerase II, partial [Candidatus Brockarchaeota archaeon]|nr:DNA polymerase II [Candidatus Brockarchaeota archaeon]